MLQQLKGARRCTEKVTFLLFLLADFQVSDVIVQPNFWFPSRYTYAFINVGKF